MEAVASRKKRQPAPPVVVFDDLTRPNRQPSRSWLNPLDDEVLPTVISADRPTRVIWSSLWIRRAEAQIVFDLSPAEGGSSLRWTLLTGKPNPDDRELRHMCQRINTLINANLRYTYGQ